MSSNINLISSALDVGSIVDNLIYVDSAPVRNMQSQVTNLQSKATAYQSLNTKLSALSNKVNTMIFGSSDAPLTPPSSFADRLSDSIFAKCTVTSSDEKLISATAVNATAGGSYSITVQGLAQAQSTASAGFADVATTTVGTGTIVITSGDDEPVTITLDSTNNTLTGVMKAINSANAGVTATVINDGSNAGSPYKLLLRANDTGLENAFTVDTSNLTGGQALGLYNTQDAQDSEFAVNGITIHSSANAVSDAIDGVTFTLKGETAVPVTLQVEKDVDSIITGFKEFVSAYNAVASFINSQFTYNSTTEKAGVLSGDATLRRIQSSLQGQLTQSISNAFTEYGVAGQVGLSFNRDGTLTLDEKKFRNALTDNFSGVAGFFVGEGNQSILKNFSDALDGITDPLSGPVHSATDGISKNIRSLNDQIDSYQARLDKQKEMLTEQFNQADEALRLMSLTQSQLSKQLGSLASTS